MSSQVRRKQDQLCRQVEERLGLVFAGDIDDPLLQELYVAGVEPEPDGVNLVVRLALPRPDISAVAVLQRLTALRTFLRGDRRGDPPQAGARAAVPRRTRPAGPG